VSAWRGGVDHRQARPARGGEQRLRRLNRLPSVLAAGAGVLPVDLAHRAITALIGLVVEVDRQNRGIVPHANLAPIGLVDFDDLLIDDVFPAMVLEIARHGHLLVRAARCD
jgi:hypothetical protein